MNSETEMMTARQEIEAPAPAGAGEDRRPVVCQLLFSLMLGGAEVLAARLARRLGDEFRMVFACLEGFGPIGEQLAADGFEVRLLDRRQGVDWRCARRLAGLLRQERFDVVHAHQYGPFFYSSLARYFGASTPIVFTEHGREFPDTTGRSHLFANRLLMGRRDRLIGVGDDVCRVLVEKEGFPRRRVEAVYNGVDLSAYAGEGIDREDVRREIGVAPGDLVVAHVARLQPIKDHATAVRAIGHLAKGRPEVRLVIVGDGPESGAIAALVRELGLGDHVRMLGRRWDVPRILKAADLALLTSLSEGIPLSLIEAMAAGLPVVATGVGGVPEVVQDGATGLLAPSGDAEALGAHLTRLAEDPALRARMGGAGRERAWALFSEDRMVADYRRIYREVIAGASGVRRAAGSNVSRGA